MKKNANVPTSLARAAGTCLAVFLACGLPAASAQDKQKISFSVGAADSKYTQRLQIPVGDTTGHTVGVFEIHRTFGADAPSIAGLKIKESWSRGYSDYVNGTNGLSTNYTVYAMDNGDKFFTHTRTMGQADAAGKRTTTGVGEVLGGTGKLAAMKGVVRSNGASDGARGFNETKTEIEYWLVK